jgi:tripartite-type tricarboxylate transporter receptor subunit TctC
MTGTMLDKVRSSHRALRAILHRPTTMAARSVLMAALLATLSIVSLMAPACAQDYPNRAIKIVVSTPPGASVDIVARLFGQYLSDTWKQPVVIENRGGANGQLAVTAVARTEPDGYTLLVTTAATLSTNPFLYPTTGPLSVTGLDPVTKLVSNDLLISVRPTFNVRTFRALLDWIRANPGKLTVATNSRGGAFNLAAELLKQVSRLDFVVIPHAGGSVAVNSTLGGHTDAIIETTTLTNPLAETGQLVPVAATGAKRSRFAPNVPTVAESGLSNYAVSGWIALVAPKRTPPAIVDRLQSELAKTATSVEMRKALDALQVSPVLDTPAQFKAAWDEDLRVWKDVIAKSGIEPER